MRINLIARAALLATFLLAPLAAYSQESVTPYGIYATDRYVLLFAKVEAPCADGGRAAQIFVSFDDGRTWAKRGPAMDGSAFGWLYAGPQGIWIAGEYVEEGPASQAFVLVPSGTTDPRWRLRVIYDDAEDLLAIGFRGSALVAQIQHLALADDGWTGPVYEHVSADAGLHWRARRIPAARSDGLIAFSEIPREHRGWKLVEQPDGSTVVQHQADSVSAWTTVSSFPAVICQTQ